MKSIAIVGYIAIALLVVSNVALSQLLQAVLKDWGQRWNCVYVIRSGFSLAIFAYLALKKYRERQGIYIDIPVRFLVFCGAILCFIGTGTSITWYFSLQLTTVAANNTVYQSVSAVVFILSVILVGEKITIKKIFSVLCSIGGVLLVSFFSKTETDDKTNTPLGFVWVFISTIFYSLYEIVYSASTDIHFTRNFLPGYEPKGNTYLPLLETADGDEADTGLSKDGDPKDSSMIRSMYFGGADDDKSLPPHNFNMKSPLIVCCTRFRGWESRLKGIGSRAMAYLEQGAPLANVPLSPMMKVELAALMLSIVGFCTLFLQWPFFFVAEATGFESFMLPSKKTALLLLAAVLVDVVFNLCLLIGIGATSPLVMAIGGILCVPASILSDKIIHGTAITPVAGIGVIFIVCGFLTTQLNFTWIKNKLFGAKTA